MIGLGPARPRAATTATAEGPGAASIARGGVHAGKHTLAAWSIAAGVQHLYLSRIMGTSLTQIDATYGHLVANSEEYLRKMLDAFYARAVG